MVTTRNDGRTHYKGEHFNIGHNYSHSAVGEDSARQDGVFVSFKGTLSALKENMYEGISTQEARAAGQALIALADEVEAAVKAAEAARIPEEPKGDVVILKFPHVFPVCRIDRGGVWRFVTSPNRSYDWEALIQRVRENGKYIDNPLDYEVLYSL